jgi:hypothetical protein
MKPFLEIPEKVIMKKVRSYIHAYRSGLSFEDRFDSRRCFEKALETILDYYRKLHGIRDLDRPLDSQIIEMNEAIAHYTPIVEELIEKTCILHSKAAKMGQINTVRVETVLLPALLEAGYKAKTWMTGSRAHVSIELDSCQKTRSLRFCINNLDDLTTERVSGILTAIQELETTIRKIGEDVSLL